MFQLAHDGAGRTKFNGNPALNAVCRLFCLKGAQAYQLRRELKVANDEVSIGSYLARIGSLGTLGKVADADGFDWGHGSYLRFQIITLQFRAVVARFGISFDLVTRLNSLMDDLLLQCFKMLYAVNRLPESKWLNRYNQRQKQIDRHLTNLLFTCRLETRLGNSPAILPFNTTHFKALKNGKGRGSHPFKSWIRFLLEGEYSGEPSGGLDHECTEKDLRVHRSLWARRSSISGGFCMTELVDGLYVTDDLENDDNFALSPLVYYLPCQLADALVAVATFIQKTVPFISELIPLRDPQSVLMMENMNYLIHESEVALRAWCDTYDVPMDRKVPSVLDEFKDLAWSDQTIALYPPLVADESHDRVPFVSGRVAAPRKYDVIPECDRPADLAHDWFAINTYDPTRMVARVLHIGCHTETDGDKLRVTSSDVSLFGWSLLAPFCLFSNVFGRGKFFQRLFLGDGSHALVQAIEDLELLHKSELEGCRISGGTLLSVRRDLDEEPWAKPFFKLCKLHDQVMRLSGRLGSKSYYYSCYSYSAQVLASSFLTSILPTIIETADGHARDRFQVLSNLSGFSSCTAAFDAHGQPAELTLDLPEDADVPPAAVDVATLSRLGALCYRSSALEPDSRVQYCKLSTSFDELTKKFEDLFTATDHTCRGAVTELFGQPARCADCFMEHPMPLYYQHHTQYAARDLQSLQRRMNLRGIPCILTDVFGVKGRFQLEAFKPLLFLKNGRPRRQTMKVVESESGSGLKFSSLDSSANSTMVFLAASAGLDMVESYSENDDMVKLVKAVFKSAVRGMALASRISELRENISVERPQLGDFMARFDSLSNITGIRAPTHIACSIFKCLTSRLGYLLPRGHFFFKMLARRFDVSHIKMNLIFDGISEPIVRPVPMNIELIGQSVSSGEGVEKSSCGNSPGECSFLYYLFRFCLFIFLFSDACR